MRYVTVSLATGARVSLPTAFPARGTTATWDAIPWSVPPTNSGISPSTRTRPSAERLKMQLRAEFFNILNHPNFSSPLLPAFIADPASNFGSAGEGLPGGGITKLRGELASTSVGRESAGATKSPPPATSASATRSWAEEARAAFSWPSNSASSFATLLLSRLLPRTCGRTYGRMDGSDVREQRFCGGERIEHPPSFSSFHPSINNPTDKAFRGECRLRQWVSERIEWRAISETTSAVTLENTPGYIGYSSSSDRLWPRS